MFNKIDARLGREFGLRGQYADLPAFQIINDAHDLLDGLTARITTLEYGGNGSLYVNRSSWSTIKEQRTRFVQRVNALSADAVKAAALSDEIIAFSKAVLEPFVAACKGSVK